MSRNIQPQVGSVVRHSSGSTAVLASRNADDTGWWIVGGGGLADRALSSPDWTVGDRIDPTVAVIAALAASEPFGVTEQMKSKYCTICGAIEGAGDLHASDCAWRSAREALGLTAEWSA